MLQLDHIAVLGQTLTGAMDRIEQCLDTPLLPGGQHPTFGTHNRLLGLSPQLYIEAIAIDPSAPDPGRARWFGLDEFTGAPRLEKWICRVEDLAAALQVFPEAGQPVDLQRGDLRWRMAVPEDGRLPFDGLFPALIEWQSDVPPGKSLPGAGCTLTRLEISHPQGAELAARISPRLEGDLVQFVTGAHGMAAHIDTPQGLKCLT